MYQPVIQRQEKEKHLDLHTYWIPGVYLSFMSIDSTNHGSPAGSLPFFGCLHFFPKPIYFFSCLRLLRRRFFSVVSNFYIAVICCDFYFMIWFFHGFSALNVWFYNVQYYSIYICCFCLLYFCFIVCFFAASGSVRERRSGGTRWMAALPCSAPVRGRDRRRSLVEQIRGKSRKTDESMVFDCFGILDLGYHLGSCFRKMFRGHVLVYLFWLGVQTTSR